MSVDISQYKVGVIISLEDCGSSRGKALRACKIRIGGTDDSSYDEATDIVTVVTSAPNVRDKSRVVVAPIGTSVQADDGGEPLEIKKVVVGGVTSEGMLCDSKMLGWIGGAKGIAVNLPDSFAVGSPPPSSKPRPNGAIDDEKESEEPAAPLPGLFEKKLSKEEKKKLAAERKAKKKAAKEA